MSISFNIAQNDLILKIAIYEINFKIKLPAIL